MITLDGQDMFNGASPLEYLTTIEKEVVFARRTRKGEMQILVNMQIRKEDQKAIDNQIAYIEGLDANISLLEKLIEDTRKQIRGEK